MEQTNSFHYLGNLLSYDNEVGADNKLNNFLEITATIRSDRKKKKKGKQQNYTMNWPFQLCYTVVKI